jgi:hypothetical protein
LTLFPLTGKSLKNQVQLRGMLVIQDIKRVLVAFLKATEEFAWVDVQQVVLFHGREV